jgi:hypothetical protein
MSKISPNHYRQGSIEVWDFIVDQELGYLEGNIVKYITRAGKKDNESKLDDLLKAQAYIHKAVSTELINVHTSTRPDGSGDPVQTDHDAASRELFPEWYEESNQFDR